MPLNTRRQEIQSETFKHGNGLKGYTFKGYLHEFDGPQDLPETLRTRSNRLDDDRSSWFGFQSAESAYRLGVSGSDEYTADVQRLIDEVNSKLVVETQGYEIDNAVAGFLPDVPSAIQNLPESMVTLEPTQKDFAPVTVWVNLTTSAGISHDIIARRGAAICALVSKLQSLRPVILKAVIGLDATHHCESQFTIIPLNMMPLNLAQVSFIFCNAGWARHCYFTTGAKYGYEGGWDEIFVRHGKDSNSDALARDTLNFLGGDPEHDIYVGTLFIRDKWDDPVSWIAGKIARYLKT